VVIENYQTKLKLTYTSIVTGIDRLPKVSVIVHLNNEVPPEPDDELALKVELELDGLSAKRVSTGFPVYEISTQL